MKKKISILIYPLIAMGFLLILTYGFKKDGNNSPNETDTVTDIDGNVYQTVTIGKQTWMVENLKVTKYRNGDAIPNVTNGTEWSNLTTGAYCEYDNVARNSAVYGKIYNWYAVADSRNIAPTGWHVPSDDEWTTLTTFLGGELYAGNKLKEKGTAHWQSANYGATNETGFSALPGGSYSGGSFYNLGSGGYWWSSTERSSHAWYRYMYYNYGGVFRVSSNQSVGCSVRCLRD